MINSLHYERVADGWWLIVDQTEDGVTWESHTWRRNLPVPLDDLTGTWIDNTGRIRRVDPCYHRTHGDVWHVEDASRNETHHYDGDTIRIWWTLDPTSQAVR